MISPPRAWRASKCITASKSLFSFSDPVAAQDTEFLQVAVVLCDDDACSSLDDRASGILVSAIDTNTSEVLGACTTSYQSQSGGCGLQLPAGAGYFLIWDTTPKGYTYRGENIVADDGPGGVITLIPFVPSGSIPQSINVNAALCTDATCSDFADHLVGFEIIAYDDASNAPLDSCLTDVGSQGNVCILTIPAGTAYYLGWNPDADPDGYDFYNVIVSDGSIGGIVHTLAFAPNGIIPTETPLPPQPTDPPVTPAPTATATSAAISGLPTTGTTGSSQAGSTGMLLLVSGLLLSGACMLGASRLRTR